MIKKSDFVGKSIDRLIEEELTVCEVCKGPTGGMNVCCGAHGGPHIREWDRLQDPTKEIVVTRKSRFWLNLGTSVNLAVSIIVMFMVIFVILEMFIFDK